MRKQTKLALGLSAAALLAVGASMTSFAARGWVAEGDQWYYYDNNGDYVTDKWKSYNGNYFYLGSDGYMLTNELIEDGNNWYYVDANGAMVKNTWVAVPADDDEVLDVDYRWYYFGSNGKAYRNSDKKTINGKKYGFDEDAKMLFGFVKDREVLDTDDPVLDCDHYYGSNDDGAMHTGWLLYQDAIDEHGDDYEDQFYWFWFDNKGWKFYRDDSDKKPGIKKINGKQYYFNYDGAMQYEWNDATFASVDGKLQGTWGWFSAAEDGHLVKSQWIWTTADGDVLPDSDDDEHWFYAEKHGELAINKVKKINGKYYAFDDLGVMQTGFVWLGEGSIKKDNKGAVLAQVDPDEITADELKTKTPNFGFFSVDEEKDGSAKTGTNIKIELYDDDYTFGFDKSTGMALDTLHNNKVYFSGMLQTAGDDKYKVVSDGDGKLYLVGKSGSRVKAGKRTYKNDEDEYYYVTGSDKGGYHIYKASESDEAKKALAADEVTEAE